METSLEEKYEAYVERYSHKPSIDQFKNYAKIKYMDAKRFILSQKQRKTSADLPTNTAPILLPKSRTNRAHSTSNHHSIPPKPTQRIKTKPKPVTPISKLSPVLMSNSGSDKSESPINLHTNNLNPLKFNPTKTNNRTETNTNLTVNKINTRKRSNDLLDSKEDIYAPSQEAHFLALGDNNSNLTGTGVNLAVSKADENGAYIYIKEDYYSPKQNNTSQAKRNSYGQDLRKYSGIDAHGNNGYYNEMNEAQTQRDRRGDVKYDNISNPYLDKTLMHNSSQIMNAYKLYIGIDFGTDGCGIAYCLPSEGNVYIHSNWKGEKQNNTNTKIKTRILLDKNGQRLAFGTAASYMYANINNNNDRDWLLFERFKMNLYSNGQKSNHQRKEEEKTQKRNNINLREYLSATNGILYESKKVFISAFVYMKEQVWYYLKKLKLHNTVKTIQDIQWILTVPAIWDDIAKNKMREWAIEAGLADETIPNHIKIVYEPDCASLSIQHTILQMRKKKEINTDRNACNGDKSLRFVGNNELNVFDNMQLFENGSKYILVDAGGGTVDISVNETMGNMKIKECICPSGGAWGSTYIDDEFIQLLDTVFTKEWMNKFRTEDSHSYYQLLNNFRNSKHTFYSKQNNKQTHNVDVTYEFISFLEEECEIYDMYLEDIISNCIYANDIELNGQHLEMSYNIWTNVLFESVLNPIIAHIDALLQKPQISDCKYLCLVGGLSDSKYFQSRIKQTFETLMIIIPERPMISVVEGAALFGLYHKFVQERVLSKCYGTSVNSKHLTKSWMNKRQVLNLTNEEKQRHYNHKRECYSKIFKPIVNKNQVLSIDGKPVIIEGARNTSNKVQKYTSIKIYQCDEYSDHSNTFFVNPNPSNGNNGNMKLMATACIVWPKGDKQRNKIILELYFHDTIIAGYVYAEKYPNDKKLLQLKYEFQ